MDNKRLVIKPLLNNIMTYKEFQILKSALKFVYAKNGNITPYIDFSNNTIVSLTYPFNFISKSKTNSGLSSVCGLYGNLQFVKQSELKSEYFRTTWKKKHLDVSLINQNGIILESNYFNYHDVNNYILSNEILLS